MAPGTFVVLERTRKRMWTWKIVSQKNASAMANLVVRLHLKREACCCNGYAAFLVVNGENRESVVCESPTWFQPLCAGKAELFSWREAGHNLEIWYNNMRVHTEMAHLFVDGIEWETKLPFDEFWKSFAVRSFLWALVMLMFAGTCLGLGFLYFIGGNGVIWSLVLYLFLLAVISLILFFIQCFIGVALLIRRPGRMSAKNITGVLSSDHEVLVEDDELQNRQTRVTAMVNIA